MLFGGLAIGARSDYDLSTNDFSLPPQYAATEQFYSSSTASFGLANISIGAWTPSVRITPSIFGGISIDGDIGDGRDTVHGNDGHDVLLGGFDVDVLQGGAGHDYLDAGTGNDVNVDGGDGDDVIRGGAGDDAIRGGNGIDNLYGDDGDDRLFGEAGDVTGNQAGQRLFGGAGRDVLFAFAPSVSNLTQFNAQTALVGDQLFEVMTAIRFMKHSPRSSQRGCWQRLCDGRRIRWIDLFTS